MTKILRGLLDACSVPELASLIFTFFAISGNRKVIGESLFSYVMYLTYIATKFMII